MQVGILSSNPDFAIRYRKLFADHHLKAAIIQIDNPGNGKVSEKYDLFVLDNQSGNFPYDLLLEMPASRFMNVCLINIGQEPPATARLPVLSLQYPGDPEPATFGLILNLLQQIQKRDAIQIDLSSLLLHDIRSPLNSLLGYLELLSKGTFGRLDSGQLTILEKAIEMGDTTLDMTEELSDIFKHEQDSFTLQKRDCDIQSLVDSVLSLVWVKADQKNIKIKKYIHPDLSRIFADDYQLQRVLTNLLNNAINHIPKNAMIHLEITPLNHDFVQFQVRDNGKGVPQKDLPHIFDKYYRYAGHNRHPKGHGLGLYICKIIAEAHGGNIKAEGNSDGGLTVTFTLPQPSGKK